MNYNFNNEPSNIFEVLWYCHFEMWRDIFHQMSAYCVQLGLPTVCKYLYLWCSTSVLVFGCWLMSHVIDFKMRQKCILLEAENFHKMTSILSQNDDFFQTWPLTHWKTLICSACNNNYFLSQLEIIHVIYGPTAKN